MEVVAKQSFKAIYFPDIRERDTKSKSFTLAFPENEKKVYETIRHFSSHEMRKVLGVKTFSDLETYATKADLPVNKFCINKLKYQLARGVSAGQFPIDPAHVTFQGAKDMPLQNWYPYLEGYSPDFVKHIIDTHVHKSAKVIYDPFSGTGTTPIVASALGFTALYSEVNPLLQFLTKVKTKARNAPNRKKLLRQLEAILPDLRIEILKHDEDQELRKTYADTFGESKFFSEKVFSHVLKTRTYLSTLYFEDILLSELVTVAVLSSLVENSFLKRQGDLRFRRGKELDDLKTIDFFESLTTRLQQMLKDLEQISSSDAPTLITEDARSVGKLPFLGIDAVITSPPYLNGTNYFRNTKVELWFLGYLKTQADLTNFRRLAVTAGINDVSLKAEKSVHNRELNTLLETLEKKAYDKRIPKMVYDYFADMETIFGDLRGQLNKDAVLAIDLGDSIYGGVHVKTHNILVSVLENIGYVFEKEIVLRKRQSNNGQELKQVLLIFRNPDRIQKEKIKPEWQKDWKNFKKNIPHHQGEMSKRNWGDPIHSLCSYQGKLKPSIASQLVSIFVPENGKMLDIFGGVGTIPLEASLQNKKSYSFDISPTAIAISRAKLNLPSVKKIWQIVADLDSWIQSKKLSQDEILTTAKFGMNKTMKDYFHPKTLEEITLARKYFAKEGYATTEHALVMSALMHILHGNRPYALSRRSHGITPFAPTGEFEYKSLIEKLTEKVDRTLTHLQRDTFSPGEVCFQDATKTWPAEVRDLDAIITSPPFFDSTRFYAANWMRLWFAGWDAAHFKTQPVNFVDELQKKDLSIYDGIFMQARERLKKDGVFVLHLGKSHKCDMADALSGRAARWFEVCDIFEESVEDGESHGIKDRGSVTKHQYLVLR
ncbi:MAG: DNA methyltransferase [Patescibacteria group bacterium]